MIFLTGLVDFILHIDVHLGQLIATYGVFTYAIIFTIIFVETGVVIMPFLPGDSLLFAIGAFCALGSLKIFIAWPLLVFAAIIGDNINYWIGRFFGQKIIEHPKIPINKNHLEKTEAFFAKYGVKTIILARFVPIVRTCTPFVAGVGKMRYRQFLIFDILGGFLWISLFILVGYFFGNIAEVKHNFSLVILAIIAVSLAPMILEIIKSKSSS